MSGVGGSVNVMNLLSTARMRERIVAKKLRATARRPQTHANRVNHNRCRHRRHRHRCCWLILGGETRAKVYTHRNNYSRSTAKTMIAQVCKLVGGAKREARARLCSGKGANFAARRVKRSRYFTISCSLFASRFYA